MAFIQISHASALNRKSGSFTPGLTNSGTALTIFDSFMTAGPRDFRRLRLPNSSDSDISYRLFWLFLH